MLSTCAPEANVAAPALVDGGRERRMLRQLVGLATRRVLLRVAGIVARRSRSIEIDLREGRALSIAACSARNAAGPWFQNCRVKPRGWLTSSARRFVARDDMDRLLDSISSNGSPLTSTTSIGPPGSASSKTPIASRPVYHASVSKLVRFF